MRHFAGMAWPVPGERLHEIERALRYGDERDAYRLRLQAASIINAYAALIWRTERERRDVIREIRRELKAHP